MTPYARAHRAYWRHALRWPILGPLLGIIEAVREIWRKEK